MKTHYVNMKNRTGRDYKQSERQIRQIKVNRDIFPTFWNVVVIWTIVLLFRSWCDLFTTVSNEWQIWKECTARIVIFHCRFLQTGARHHDVSGTVFHSSLELQRKGKVIQNRFPYSPTLKEKAECISQTTYLHRRPSASSHDAVCASFGASLPALEHTSTIVCFLSFLPGS